MAHPLTHIDRDILDSIIRLGFIWSGRDGHSSYMDKIFAEHEGVREARLPYAGNYAYPDYSIITVVASAFLEGHHYFTKQGGLDGHVVNAAHDFILSALLFPNPKPDEAQICAILQRAPLPETYEFGSYDAKEWSEATFESYAVLLQGMASLAREGAAALQATFEAAEALPSNATKWGNFCINRSGNGKVAELYAETDDIRNRNHFNPLLPAALNEVADTIERSLALAETYTKQQALADKAKTLQASPTLTGRLQSVRSSTVADVLQTISQGEEPDRELLLALHRRISPSDLRGKNAYMPIPEPLTDTQRRDLSDLLAEAVKLYAPDALESNRQRLIA